jgi:glucose-6-phosphate isomerase
MAKEQQQGEVRRLDELFTAEPGRLASLTFHVAGIYFDWSKTHLDAPIVGQAIERS